MTAAALRLIETETETPDEVEGVVETSILSFLNGETDGRDLFQALYGDVADEPVPEKMLALVRSACRSE
jgi:hypothetical protein